MDGLDCVSLAEGGLLIRSDTLSLRLEGESIGLFASEILPLLADGRSLDELSVLLPRISRESLLRTLDALTNARVLLRTNQRPVDLSDRLATLSPWLGMLRSLGVDTEEALAALAKLRVAIFGLEGHGSHLASLLCRCGVGTVFLVDPFRCEPGNLGLMDGADSSAIGTPREAAVHKRLERQEGGTRVITSGLDAITAEAVSDIAQQSDVMVGCFDKGFSAVHLWINEAGLSHHVPSIYSRSQAHLWTVGPLVIPHQTPCFLCYRMRELACAPDHEPAAAYERALDASRFPRLHERAVFPQAMPYFAALLSGEIMKFWLGVRASSLAASLLEFDVLSLRVETHRILQHPNCPACFSRSERELPTFRGLIETADGRAELAVARDWLVSRRTGVIRVLRPVLKSYGEPAVPFLQGAELSNFSLHGSKVPRQTGGGKGFTVAAAQLGALGEAVEHYSAGNWSSDEVTYCRRDELTGRSLDPSELVLYSLEQYQQLPYAPYDETTVLGWITARSLVTDEAVAVPALAGFMNYRPRSPEEYICSTTSNGMAAGHSLLAAVLNATIEVLERDAFMIGWLRRLRCDAFDATSHPDEEVAQLGHAFRRRGLEVRALRLATDHPVTVFAALGVNRAGGGLPSVVVGLGASFDPLVAAKRAVLELGQIHAGLIHTLEDPAARARMDQLARDPQLVCSLEDHVLLYAHPGSLSFVDFFLDRAVKPWDFAAVAERSPAELLSELIVHFRGRGQDLMYVNLTPTDMELLGVFTARVIIPGFQPIHFGAKEARLGGRRLYDFSGHENAAGSGGASKLNPYPHPFG